MQARNGRNGTDSASAGMDIKIGARNPHNDGIYEKMIRAGKFEYDRKKVDISNKIHMMETSRAAEIRDDRMWIDSIRERVGQTRPGYPQISLDDCEAVLKDKEAKHAAEIHEMKEAYARNQEAFVQFQRRVKDLFSQDFRPAVGIEMGTAVASSKVVHGAETIQEGYLEIRATIRANDGKRLIWHKKNHKLVYFTQGGGENNYLEVEVTGRKSVGGGFTRVNPSRVELGLIIVEEQNSRIDPAKVNVMTVFRAKRKGKVKESGNPVQVVHGHPGRFHLVGGTSASHEQKCFFAIKVSVKGASTIATFVPVDGPSKDRIWIMSKLQDAECHRKQSKSVGVTYVDGKRKHLGYFPAEDNAGRAYDAAAALASMKPKRRSPPHTATAESRQTKQRKLSVQAREATRIWHMRGAAVNTHFGGLNKNVRVVSSMPNTDSHTFSATKTDSAASSTITHRKQSEFVGVTWYEPTKKWVARIYADGKNKYLGCFPTEVDAARAYDAAAALASKPLNFPGAGQAKARTYKKTPNWENDPKLNPILQKAVKEMLKTPGITRPYAEKYGIPPRTLRRYAKKERQRLGLEPRVAGNTHFGGPNKNARSAIHLASASICLSPPSK